MSAWLRRDAAYASEDDLHEGARVTPPVSQNNVRLVAVDDEKQPAYLRRVAHLEKRLLAAAEALGVHAEDMPALRGLCVEAVRSAEARQPEGRHAEDRDP